MLQICFKQLGFSTTHFEFEQFVFATFHCESSPYPLAMSMRFNKAP